MLFFIGSYTNEGAPASQPSGAGISSCSFDSKTGEMMILESCFQRNPSYPIVSADGTMLYAAEEMIETDKPMLIAYKILDNGSLHKLNEVSLKGDCACHLAIVNQTIIAANYVSGDILMYPIMEDGQIGPLMQHIQHQGFGMNKDRQEAPHPHMIYPIDDHTFYCVDLGIDMAKAYRSEAPQSQWQPLSGLDITVNQGAGARHMDMNNDHMVINGELTGELFLFHKVNEGFQLCDTVALGEKEMAGAAIRIHANGKFVYCSDRKTNSIYAFSINNNRLQPIGKYPCQGVSPRDISIDPTGQWLLSANQDNNTIAEFCIEPQTGKLQFIRSYPVATPCCICWQKTDKINF